MERAFGQDPPVDYADGPLLDRGFDMNTRRRWMPLLLPGGILISVLGLLLGLLKAEPAFYRQAHPPDNYDTREKASHLLTRIQDLKYEIRTRPSWGIRLRADELNCFFAETMGPTGSLVGWLPPGFHSPRLAIEGDRLYLGVRYGRGWWSIVVSLQLRLWLVANEVNVVAVEVSDLRLGRLGLAAQSILDALAEAAHACHVDVHWYRHGGHPVGLFRFFPDQPQPVSQILTLEVHDGALTVAGRTRVEAMAAPPP
ncbi:MAG: hypothetical protein NZU63_09515 [Gemmataceae bacterium]|nr:hypothetical protein [Gemmataceae bacterium]MDW8244423.1 hypothetical protein [Thermogemmata sp.]